MLIFNFMVKHNKCEIKKTLKNIQNYNKKLM